MASLEHRRNPSYVSGQRSVDNAGGTILASGGSVQITGGTLTGGALTIASSSTMSIRSRVKIT